MERIEGTVTTAISYAKIIDDKAKEQIRRMCSYELTAGSKVEGDYHEISLTSNRSNSKNSFSHYFYGWTIYPSCHRC